MANIKTKEQKRNVRHARVRAKVFGTDIRPRLSVFKSNKFIYGQIIDDSKGTTIVSASSKGISGKGLVEKAKTVGQEIAKLAKTKKIEQVVFDRGGYIYTGVIKSFADGARDGGLIF